MGGRRVRAAGGVLALLLAACGAGPQPSPASATSSPPASSASRSPGGPPSSSSAPAPAPSRVTTAQNGRTLTLHVGQSFVLALGGLQWAVTISNPAVLRRVPDEAVVAGQQGVYDAIAAGETTLRASGRPICTRDQACPMFIVGFGVTIEVTG